MKPFEQLTRRVTLGAGIVVCAAMTVLALSSASARAGAGANSDKAQASTAAGVKDVRGATPYIELKNEPPPKLIVDPPLPDLLAQGVVWIQWRAENVHILPVFGKGALSASPRIGHLRVHVDD